VTLREAVGASDSPLRLLARGLQLCLVAIAGFALVTFDLGLLVNGGLPLLVSFVPTALKRRHGHEMNPALELWIVTAAFLHAVGALGPYTMFGWYDQVAHTVSAALVAGVGYAFVRAVDRSHDDTEIPPTLRFVFVVAFGVLWEIVEFASGGIASLLGGEAVLAQYGVDDIALDLLFNAVGAVIVGIWGTGYFDGVAGILTRRIDDRERAE